MSVMPDPFDQTNSNPNPQPFTGGSNIAPMPVSTARDNPFTDVLNHVSAFNDALNPKPVAMASLALPAPLSPQQPTDPDAQVMQKPPPVVGPSIVPAPLSPVPPSPDPRARASAPPVVYSDANPPPKPSDADMADPEKAATYYRLFTYKNPAFANITGDDVNTQRSLAVSGQFAAAIWPDGKAHPEYQDFATWFLAGKPTPPPAQAGPPTVTPPTGNPDQWVPSQYGGLPFDPKTGIPISPAAPPPASPPAPPAPPVAPPGPPQPPPPVTPPGPPAAPPVVPPPDIQSLIDMFKKEADTGNGPDIESMLNPMFARQRQLASDQMRAEAALTPGRLESGGFGQNEGQAISDLSGKQSATMADALQQQHLAQMQQNTQLMTLATTAGMQKYVTDINADLTKFQVNSNADLQKWLDSADNALKKYGIDTGDVLARYQSELQLKGQMYSADRGVDAAALQAAAAHAAAAASSAASMANAQLQYQLGMQGLSVDREKNIGQWILGLLGVGNMDINTLNGILAGLLPGTTVVKP